MISTQSLSYTSRPFCLDRFRFSVWFSCTYLWHSLLKIIWPHDKFLSRQKVVCEGHRHPCAYSSPVLLSLTFSYPPSQYPFPPTPPSPQALSYPHTPFITLHPSLHPNPSPPFPPTFLPLITFPFQWEFVCVIILFSKRVSAHYKNSAVLRLHFPLPKTPPLSLWQRSIAARHLFLLFQIAT